MNKSNCCCFACICLIVLVCVWTGCTACRVWQPVMPGGGSCGSAVPGGGTALSRRLEVAPRPIVCDARRWLGEACSGLLTRRRTCMSAVPGGGMVWRLTSWRLEAAPRPSVGAPGGGMALDVAASGSGAAPVRERARRWRAGTRDGSGGLVTL